MACDDKNDTDNNTFHRDDHNPPKGPQFIDSTQNGHKYANVHE
jgi:hypothetical protein